MDISDVNKTYPQEYPIPMNWRNAYM